jgi:hypothetical protein
LPAKPCRRAIEVVSRERRREPVAPLKILQHLLPYHARRADRIAGVEPVHHRVAAGGPAALLVAACRLQLFCEAAPLRGCQNVQRLEAAHASRQVEQRPTVEKVKVTDRDLERVHALVRQSAIERLDRDVFRRRAFRASPNNPFDQLSLADC